MSTEVPIQQKVPSEFVPTSKGLLINRNFALLAIGQAISNIGDFVYSTTLLVWVFVLTHSAVAVGGVLIAQYAPVFLLGPVAGVFVDRWNRRRTMITADLVRAVVALLPLLAPAPLRLPAIYSSVFLLSAFSRFFMPARAGMQQVIVPARQQGQAASISQATFALAIIVGPAIASPLYFVVGPVIAVLINAVSFVISALCLRAIRASKDLLRPRLAPAAGDSAPESVISAVLREMLAGFRFVAKTRVLFIVVILALIAMLGSGAINALDIIFVSRNLHVSASLYGPLTAAAGAGTLIGAILAGIAISRVQPRYMLTGSVFLLGVGLIIYSFQSWYLLALIITFIMCIPQGGIDVGFMPLLLGVTPNAMIGRVQSVIETAMFATSLISAALAGYFGQFVPVSIIFAIGGALIAIAGVFGWFSLPNETSTQS
jgi:predicted MFS family arabinose efflux permease